MLNLYLAVRGTVAVDAEVETRLLAFLTDALLIGALGPEGDYAPGPEVQWIYSDDAHETLLPAELTFESLSVGRSARPRFLPEAVEAFEEAKCLVCDDPLNVDELADELTRLAVFPVDRFEHLCPSCRTPLTIKQVDFGQPTAVSCFWLFIEGAGTSRLSVRLLERLSKTCGSALVVVPEVLEDRMEGWTPPPIRGQRRRRR
jgi:uncharacterized protein YlaI